ncbi:hypothetical protein MTR_4g077460 [Medicago truncatula]|uniref:Uncharacterized protein n=1 Tax=Medicago truncatula TaxID=3880 RepID=G7JRP9_MEDTR|nr:hypothetical protein MTR_4g077460 [Medicago truncatula]
MSGHEVDGMDETKCKPLNVSKEADIYAQQWYFFFFLVDRQNGKVIINSHTQVEVPGFEPWS